MSELVWGIKNGDLEIVKAFVENKVSSFIAVFMIRINFFIIFD